MTLNAAEAKKRVGLAALTLFLVTAGFIAIKTGRDALYIKGDGLFGLPQAYMATAVLAIPQAMGMLALLKRLGPRRTRIIVLLAILGVVGSYYALAEPGGSLLMTTFFFLVPLVFSVVFSMVWLLGTALLEELPKDQTSKAFSRLGAASIVGGLCGGLLARSAGPVIGPRGLLLAGGLLVAATLVLVIGVHRMFPPPSRPLQTDKGTGGSMVGAFKHRGVGLLLGISMAAAMTGIFVDFQFYLAATAHGPDDHTVYFANVYLILSGASLLLQLLAAPWLQRVIGIRRSLLVLPVALFGGATVVLLMGTLLARAGLRVMEGGLKSGVHRTTWEQAYLRVPKEDRPSAKVLVDGLGARIAEGIAGLILQAWLLFAAGGLGVAQMRARWVASVSAIWITILLIATALVWMVLSLLLARRLRGEPEAAPDDEGALMLRAPLPDS